MNDVNIKHILLDFLRQNYKIVLGYLFFTLSSPMTNVLIPYLYGLLISELNKSRKINNKVIRLFSYLIILWLIVQLFWLSINKLDTYFIPEIKKNVRKYIISKILYAYSENYSKEELGSLFTSLIILPNIVETIFHNIRTHVLPLIYSITFSIGYFTWINPYIGIMSLFFIIGYVLIAIKFSMRCMPIQKKLNINEENLHNKINDTFDNLLNIYTSNQITNEQNNIEKYEEEFKKDYSNIIKCNGNFRLILNCIYILLFSTINILSFYLFTKGDIPINQVITVLIISVELVSKMNVFINSIGIFTRKITTINQKQVELNNLGGDIQRCKGSINNVNLNGDIIFDNVSILRSNKIIVNNISLFIPKGKTSVLTGQIGIGKTSLVSSLIRLIPIDKGSVYINGYNINELDLSYLRNNITYIPQNPTLFNKTIYENINYGINIDKQTIKEKLIEYNLNINLDEIVGKNGMNLSGGQRQIIYLLRCIFNNTPIVILDEPTSSLDMKTKYYIMDLIRIILKDKTVIVISHDKDVINYSHLHNIIQLT